MSKPEVTARRGRPTRPATVSHFKMTAVDIDRIARTAVTKHRQRTLLEVYLIHSATYYADPCSPGEGAGKTLALVPLEKRPSFAQSRYWVSKTCRPGKP